MAFAQRPPSVVPAETLASLQARLSNHLAQPRFAAAAWGVKIVSLNTDKTLFEFGAQKLLKPASNAKLFTGALALDRLGPAYRIRTSLYAAAPPNSSGTLAGDLFVWGRGDPCFAARFNDGDYRKSLEPLAQALAMAGVKRITGDLVGDERFFRGPPRGTGWMWDDLQYYYAAEVSALTADDNVVDLVFSPGPRVGAPCQITAMPATPFLDFFNRTETMAKGGARQITLYRPVGENSVYVTGGLSISDTNYTDAVTVPQPARWFLARFKEALTRQGITLGGQLRTVNWLERGAKLPDYSQLIELAHVESRRLTEIVNLMMKRSQNLYAQLLLLQVGACHPKSASARPTTEEAGLAEMEKFLATAGVRPGEVFLEEGSGLSRGTLLTPNATVTLLRTMHRHRYAQAFLESLPIAGVDGTLRHRMKGTPAADNARAKPGALRHVHTLSGYVTTAAGERLAFSLLLNNYQPEEHSDGLRADLDALVVMLACFQGRSN